MVGCVGELWLMGQGGHGGLEGSLGWVTYLGRTANLEEDLDWLVGCD